MLNFRNRLCALALLMSALMPFESCDLGGLFGWPTLDVQLDTPFQLAIGQTGLLRAESLTITFEDVLEDSRCPVDVVCIWAGNAKVSIEVKQTGKAMQTLALNSTLEPREAGYEGLRIRYEALMPQPRFNHPIRRENYRLSLSVSR